MSGWSRWAESRLEAIRGARRERRVRVLDGKGQRARLEDGREVVSFASNDYLGLSMHPSVVAAAQEALERWGSGSGASRLVTGTRPIHVALERALAQWKGTERALLFSSGYAANLSVLSVFAADESTMICSDELNHASIVDACRLARARVAVFPHRDMGALDRLLRSATRAIVVSDTVFSMDGDVAPVDDLVALCRKYDALLVLDEAHAVFGPHPRLDGVAHVRVGTLSKTLGSLGGFAATSSAFADLMINRARPFIFSTAPTPAETAAARAALEIVRDAEGERLVARLRALVNRIAPQQAAPIVPVILGDEASALAASEQLLEEGIFVPAIRPPSVPAGSARLRVTLSAAHDEQDVDRLAAALGKLQPRLVRA